MSCASAGESAATPESPIPFTAATQDAVSREQARPSIDHRTPKIEAGQMGELRQCWGKCCRSVFFYIGVYDDPARCEK